MGRVRIERRRGAVEQTRTQPTICPVVSCPESCGWGQAKRKVTGRKFSRQPDAITHTQTRTEGLISCSDRRLERGTLLATTTSLQHPPQPGDRLKCSPSRITGLLSMSLFAPRLAFRIGPASTATELPPAKCPGIHFKLSSMTYRTTHPPELSSPPPSSFPRSCTWSRLVNPLARCCQKSSLVQDSLQAGAWPRRLHEADLVPSRERITK